MASASSATSSKPQEASKATFGLRALRDPTILGQVFAKVPTENLLRFRFLNKQWNVPCIQTISRRYPLKRMVLDGSQITEHLNYLRSQRSKRLGPGAFYSGAYKYDFRFTCNYDSKSKAELDAAKLLVKNFGPSCVRSIDVLVSQAGPFTSTLKGPIDELCNSLEEIICGTDLVSMHIALVWYPETNAKSLKNIGSYVPQLLNSVNSVSALNIAGRVPKFWGLPTELGYNEYILASLAIVKPAVLNNLELLEVVIGPGECYTALSRFKFPKLKTLNLVILDATGYEAPNDWSGLRRFLRHSCPALINCTFALDEGVGSRQFVKSLPTGYRNSFPCTSFTISRDIVDALSSATLPEDFSKLKI